MKPACASSVIWAAMRAARACWAGVGGTLSFSQPGSGASRIPYSINLVWMPGSAPISGGGGRPARRAGTGEEPAVGGGKAGRLRGLGGPGTGGGDGAAPVGDRAVRPLRAGPVRGGAPDAAHQPAVHRPPGGAAAVPG